MTEDQVFMMRNQMHQEQVKNSTDKIFASKTTDELIAHMQEDEATAAREKILQSMTPACRKKLKYIETWFRTEVDHTIRSRYELGLQVKELYEDEKKNSGKLYGKNAIGRICTILCWDDGLIRMALRFVQKYSQDDLEHLCSMQLQNGEPLTWSHVRCLIAVDDSGRRKELLDKTVAEGWTCTELAQEIKSLSDHSESDGRGRPPRVPKDFDSAIAQQQQSSEEWNRRYDKVWNAQELSLEAQAAKLPLEEVTEERLYQARQLASQLRRVAKEALEQAEQAELVVVDFERILDERRQGKSAEEPDTATRNKSSSKQLPLKGNEKRPRLLTV
jgi:hypothetical protein